MPIYVQECGTCAESFEHIRAISQIDNNPPCPCGGETHRILRPSTNSGYVDAVVVYQAPDGSVRFPGMGEGRSVAYYKSLGFTRREIRGAADMRRFEGQMNARERSIMARKLERKLEMREQRESHMRSQLRGLMTSMTPLGRDLARAAMRANDHKPRERTADANFHSEVYSFNRSNRDASRDRDGRRHRD
jgi:putative FmdB family regulatory protein